MFLIAIYFAVLAYVIQIMGLFGLISPLNCAIITPIISFVFLILGIRIYQPHISFPTGRYISNHRLLIMLTLGFGVVISIGALGPEIKYDALWYHLTLPKLYLETGKIAIIQGHPPWYYSAMPALGEMLYVVALAIRGEVVAKLLHAICVFFTARIIFSFIQKQINTRAAWFGVVLFLSNMTVLWSSTTADIDLFRTLYETLGCVSFLKWLDRPTKKNGALLGIWMGCAISVKTLSLGTAAIIGFLMLVKVFILRHMVAERQRRVISIVIYGVVAALVGGYWYVRSYIVTGNPVYPALSTEYNQHFYFPGPQSVIEFVSSPMLLSSTIGGWDASMSPIYIALLPLILYCLKGSKQMRWMLGYCALYYLVWFLLPRSGGARFIMPVYPIASILVTYAVFAVDLPKLFRLVGYVSALMVALSSLLIQGYIVKKNLPVIFHHQSKEAFLVQNLNLNTVYFQPSSFQKYAICSEREIAWYYAPFTVIAPYFPPTYLQPCVQENESL